MSLIGCDVSLEAQRAARREAAIALPQVHVSPDPKVQDMLTRVRPLEATGELFRQPMGMIGGILVSEATSMLATEERSIMTPLAPMMGRRICGKIGIVTILTAGLVFEQAALDLFPDAKLQYLGIKRNEETLQPHLSYECLLDDLSDFALNLILDPMHATGGTANLAVSKLKEHGAKRIAFIGALAAPEGIEELVRVHPDVSIHLGAVDTHLNERGFIVPGLGDAGDRRRNTV